MSQEEAPTEAKKTNPVETQAVSVGQLDPRHKCCEHCMPDAHAPHTLGCPPETNGHVDKEAVNEAVKAAFADMFEVTEAWKPREVVKFVIECPSGQKVLVKHLDILDLAAVDLVEDMDSFSKKLLPNKFDDQGRPVDEEPKSLWSSLKDIKKRQQFLDMTNRLMAVASVRPKVIDDGVAVVKDEEGTDTIKFGYQMTVQEQLEYFEKPIPPLEPKQAYAGTIGFVDRMAFFTELNKPLGMIEPFREGSTPVLEGVESVERVGSQTQ